MGAIKHFINHIKMLSKFPKRTLRIRKATTCITDLRCSRLGGVRISRPSVVMNNAVLLEAI